MPRRTRFKWWSRMLPFLRMTSLSQLRGLTRVIVVLILHELLMRVFFHWPDYLRYIRFHGPLPSADRRIGHLLLWDMRLVWLHLILDPLSGHLEFCPFASSKCLVDYIFCFIKLGFLISCLSYVFRFFFFVLYIYMMFLFLFVSCVLLVFIINMFCHF